MKLILKESALKNSKVPLLERNGKFELSKPQITKGNIVNIQIGGKNFNIKL